MSSILIQHGTILDPASKAERKADLLIRDDKIAAIGANLGHADKTIDAAGCFVAPGLIDVHVHFREPGDEEEETIASGAAAAVAGGFSSVFCMANTKPPLDNEAAIQLLAGEDPRGGVAEGFPIGHHSQGGQGNESG